MFLKTNRYSKRTFKFNSLGQPENTLWQLYFKQSITPYIKLKPFFDSIANVEVHSVPKHHLYLLGNQNHSTSTLNPTPRWPRHRRRWPFWAPPTADCRPPTADRRRVKRRRRRFASAAAQRSAIVSLIPVPNIWQRFMLSLLSLVTLPSISAIVHWMCGACVQGCRWGRRQYRIYVHNVVYFYSRVNVN
jgi:hypothetical protein